MQSEHTKQKNKEKVDAHDRNIPSRRQQISELQAKISDAEKDKHQLLEFDEVSMAQDLSFGMEFVEKAQQLESDVKLLR